VAGSSPVRSATYLKALLEIAGLLSFLGLSFSLPREVIPTLKINWLGLSIFTNAFWRLFWSNPKTDFMHRRFWR
ncbi:hypothetical protein P3719_21825, partial [Vibrio parahaemolyticus]|nr:hypothetical protein [Vibrio parahaemolyticus]MDF5585536.1 hypothetical protein [Vibrio parahaemolyticus]MDF5590761.1 hypothetical protein [Vibrio parahaemolyticus]MDG2871970.1 hypothetical protein [Vibrio parahaemolyticus]MDG2888488.1 hypothetical protein [Vibrio parahaemolyticus]